MAWACQQVAVPPYNCHTQEVLSGNEMCEMPVFFFTVPSNGHASNNSWNPHKKLWGSTQIKRIDGHMCIAHECSANLDSCIDKAIPHPHRAPRPPSAPYSWTDTCLPGCGKRTNLLPSGLRLVPPGTLHHTRWHKNNGPSSRPHNSKRTSQQRRLRRAV
jgi:hypothetical protein